MSPIPTSLRTPGNRRETKRTQTRSSTGELLSMDYQQGLAALSGLPAFFCRPKTFSKLATNMCGDRPDNKKRVLPIYTKC
jgi:hypothetical protein